MNVIIYTGDNCKWCVSAKELLTRKGFSYEERNVAYHMDTFREKGWRTVPQIIIDDVYVGGFEKLTQWFAEHTNA